jgi:hypothetical protein
MSLLSLEYTNLPDDEEEEEEEHTNYNSRNILDIQFIIYTQRPDNNIIRK